MCGGWTHRRGCVVPSRWILKARLGICSPGAIAGSRYAQRDVLERLCLSFYGAVLSSIHKYFLLEKCRPQTPSLHLSPSTVFLCSVDDFCCFLSLSFTHSSLAKPAHSFSFYERKTKSSIYLSRVPLRLSGSCARYGSLHQWPFIPDLLQVLFSSIVMLLIAHRCCFILFFLNYYYNYWSRLRCLCQMQCCESNASYTDTQKLFIYLFLSEVECSAGGVVLFFWVALKLQMNSVTRLDAGSTDRSHGSPCCCRIGHLFALKLLTFLHCWSPEKHSADSCDSVMIPPARHKKQQIFWRSVKVHFEERKGGVFRDVWVAHH